MNFIKDLDYTIDISKIENNETVVRFGKDFKTLEVYNRSGMRVFALPKEGFVEITLEEKKGNLFKISIINVNYQANKHGSFTVEAHESSCNLEFNHLFPLLLITSDNIFNLSLVEVKHLNMVSSKSRCELGSHLWKEEPRGTQWYDIQNRIIYPDSIVENNQTMRIHKKQFCEICKIKKEEK